MFKFIRRHSATGAIEGGAKAFDAFRPVQTYFHDRVADCFCPGQRRSFCADSLSSCRRARIVFPAFGARRHHHATSGSRSWQGFCSCMEWARLKDRKEPKKLLKVKDVNCFSAALDAAWRKEMTYLLPDNTVERRYMTFHNLTSLGSISERRIVLIFIINIVMAFLQWRGHAKPRAGIYVYFSRYWEMCS